MVGAGAAIALRSVPILSLSRHSHHAMLVANAVVLVVGPPKSGRKRRVRDALDDVEEEESQVVAPPNGSAGSGGGAGGGVRAGAPARAEHTGSSQFSASGGWVPRGGASEGPRSSCDREAIGLVLHPLSRGNHSH